MSASWPLMDGADGACGGGRTVLDRSRTAADDSLVNTVPSAIASCAGAGGVAVV